MARKKKAFTTGIALAVLSSFLAIMNGCQLSEKDALEVTLLKVGKADAIVVQAQAQTMVIDTGEDDDGAELVSFLKSQGCEKVDTLIITHFDKDHVGGADRGVELKAQVFLENNTRRCVVKSKTVQRGLIELNLEVRLNDANTDFVNALGKMAGVNSVVLVSYNGDYMG